MSENEADVLRELPELEKKCSKCNGSGAIGNRRCTLCDGSGYETTEFGEKVLALVCRRFQSLLARSIRA